MNLYRVIAVASCVLLLAGCRTARPSSTGESWQLVWADEFEGEQLDLTSWTVEVMPDPFNDELQYYPDRVDDDPGSNIWLEDGALVIEAREETYEHRHYTSGRIKTQGKREFLYGRIEARIQQPAEVGMWPAFWMLGGNIDEVGWPACGEIDIMEGKGRLPEWTSAALHYGADPENHAFVWQDHTLSEGDFHSQWHVFAVEWETEQVRWLVNDEEYYRVDKPRGVSRAEWPFDHGHPYFILLNLAVGGKFDAPHMPPEGMEPQRLYVDYIRVYQRSPR